MSQFRSSVMCAAMTNKRADEGSVLAVTAADEGSVLAVAAHGCAIVDGAKSYNDLRVVAVDYTK